MYSSLQKFAALSMFVRMLLITEVLAIIIGSIATVFELQLLADLRDGNVVSTEQIDASGAWQSILGIAQIALFIGSGIMVFVWIYRAHRNLRLLQIPELKFTPGWAVGWFFVPFANMVKPYQAMRELWKASAYGYGQYWPAAETPLTLIIWWMVSLTSIILARISVRITLDAETLDELISADVVILLSNGVDILAAVLTMVVVMRIYKAQEELFLQAEAKQSEAQQDSLPAAVQGLPPVPGTAV